MTIEDNNAEMEQALKKYNTMTMPSQLTKNSKKPPVDKKNAKN